MKYTNILLLPFFLCVMSCTMRRCDYKDWIVQLQSHPISLSLDKMRCMCDGQENRETLLANRRREVR